MSDRPKQLERNLFLTADIDAASVDSLIKEIIKINADDAEKENDYINWVRKPIYIYINSGGGECYSSFALVDIIQASKTPIYTVALGRAMSAGLTIFMAGHKRFIGKYSTLMFHDVSYNNSVSLKTEEMIQEIGESNRLRNMIYDLLLANTELTKENLDDYVNRKAEWFISAEEAIRLKLAHEYYK